MRKHRSFFIFNLTTLRSLFGDSSTRSLKVWLDLNYKVIKCLSHISFLTECKRRGLIPKHLDCVKSYVINVSHYIAVRKLKNLICNLKNKLLNLELFDLYRSVYHLNHKIYVLNSKLKTLFPTYILSQIMDYHHNSFNKYRHMLFLNKHKKIMWLINRSNIETFNNILPIRYHYVMDRSNPHKIKKLLPGTPDDISA